MCHRCDGFLERRPVNSLNEYRDLVRQILETVQEGTLRLVNGTCPLEEILTPSSLNSPFTLAGALPTGAREHRCRHNWGRCGRAGREGQTAPRDRTGTQAKCACCRRAVGTILPLPRTGQSDSIVPEKNTRMEQFGS